MYEEYFGLERPPFKITPDTSLFYDGGKRGDILAALVYAIHRGEGIVKVVGEVGSGKTMLCRMLQLKLPDTVEIVYIANPSVSAADILFVIAHELSLPVVKEASKHEVMHMLQDYLLQRHIENKQVVLFVEEAQGMPLDTLEEIRLLSNLETDENKLLQIILFGQPELDQNLAQQSIRQLRERITHNFELEPLTRNEIHNYLNFRMRQVGYTGPELINNTVAKKVEQHSEGLLRRINIIADKILLSAFAEGTHNLSSKHVTAAVNDSSFGQEVEPKNSSAWWLAPLLLAALAFALYLGRGYWMPVAAIDMPVEQGAAIEDDRVIEPASTETDQAIAPANAENGQAIEPASAETDQAIAARVAENPEPEVAGTSLFEKHSNLETEVDVEAGAEQSEVVVDADADQPEVDSAAIDSGGESSMTAAQPQSEMLAEKPDDTVQAQQAEVTAGEIEAAEQAPEVIAPSLQAQGSAAEQAPEITVPSLPAQEGEAVNLQQEGSEVASSELSAASAGSESGPGEDFREWMKIKLAESREWLANSGQEQLSIQVMVRNKSAARELVYYLLNEWPLALSDTYLFEVVVDNRIIYRVFYSEFDSVSQARAQIDQLPDNVKANLPYVHSVYLMRRDLL